AHTAGENLSLTWYDGLDHKPVHAEVNVPEDVRLPGAGSLLIGENGIMVIPHWSIPNLYPAEKFREFKMPEVGEVNHYTSWVEAALDNGNASSNFGYAGPLTEAVLLGVVAIRFPKEQLQWD